MTPDTVKLRELAEKAIAETARCEWEVHDSCSWRRIKCKDRYSTNVLEPYASRSDKHPDLDACQEVLDHIVANSPIKILSLCDTIEAQAKRIAELEKVNARLLLEAQAWAGEAKTQRANVHDALQIASGATGEKGDWNGAQPIKNAIDDAREKAIREAAAVVANNDIVSTSEGSKLNPRIEGNVHGMTYATAILALLEKPE